MKYQVSATLKQIEYDSSIEILKMHNIPYDRDFHTGRIACFSTHDEAIRVKNILQSELSYIVWRIEPIE